MPDEALAGWLGELGCCCCCLFGFGSSSLSDPKTVRQINFSNFVGTLLSLPVKMRAGSWKWSLAPRFVASPPAIFTDDNFCEVLCFYCLLLVCYCLLLVSYLLACMRKFCVYWSGRRHGASLQAVSSEWVNGLCWCSTGGLIYLPCLFVLLDLHYYFFTFIGCVLCSFSTTPSFHWVWPFSLPTLLPPPSSSLYWTKGGFCVDPSCLN